MSGRCDHNMIDVGYSYVSCASRAINLAQGQAAIQTRVTRA